MDEQNIDIADILDGHAERFVPESMGGLLIDAEHRGRYWWAAALVPGKQVLDAACGTGYGARILAMSGATTVIGVDRAAHVIESARKEAPSQVTFEVGDLLDLPFADSAFDVAVCFEAIEHVEEPGRALDELARVLRPDGILAISSPNRTVYVQGNPHHRHEYIPDELSSDLRTRFQHVRLVRQHNWLAAAILEDSAFEGSDGTAVKSPIVRKIASGQPGAETYTLALASNKQLPAPPAVVVLTQDLEIRRLIDGAASAENEHRQVEALLREGEERQRVIDNLEAEALRAQAAAQAAQDRLRTLTDARIFRIVSKLAGAVARVQKLARRD